MNADCAATDLTLLSNGRLSYEKAAFDDESSEADFPSRQKYRNRSFLREKTVSGCFSIVWKNIVLKSAEPVGWDHLSYDEII